MAGTDAEEPTNAKRRRRGGPRRKTGCSTCKTRHTRCDEKSDENGVCGNCKRLGLHCQASDFIYHSSWDTTSGGKPNRANGNGRTAPNEAALTNGRTSQDAQDALERFTTASTSVPARTQNVSAIHDPPLDISNENVYLLSTYRSGVATWMDLFDTGNEYQNSVIRVGTTCPLLLRCICAFTAKHLSMKASGAAWEPIASRYYVEALSLLIREIDCSAPTANSLTAAILLSSYEVMAALGGPHRSHYQGALDLIRARNVSASSLGSDGKNFRIYVRHELVVSLVNETPLQLDPNDWRMPPLEASSSEDQMAMHVMWLAGRSINLVFGDNPSAGRQEVIDSLDAWYEAAPPTLQGTKYGQINEDGLHNVFFAVPAAAAAMLWYHMAYIVLSAERCNEASLKPALAQQHATALLSIGISDLPDCVRCFAIVPIYVAGKHIQSVALKFRSWSLLMDIERELGYRTNAMVKALKDTVR